MIALWMVYATAVAALVGSGAALLELASGGHLRQRRWLWMLALALAVEWLPPVRVLVPGRMMYCSSSSSWASSSEPAAPAAAA